MKTPITTNVTNFPAVADLPCCGRAPAERLPVSGMLAAARNRYAK